jgi:3-dehydroquinate synthase
MEYIQQFSVPFSYPVSFTHGAFDSTNPTLKTMLSRATEATLPRVLVVVDQGLADARPGLLTAITAYLQNCRELCRPIDEPVLVPGGERTKNGWNVVQNLMTVIGTHHLCRHSIVLAVGGGSMLDMTGFAASLAHRGVRLIRVPTTTLAQGDAAVGVKNGMDEHGMKNFVGTFSPPFGVIVDFDFLSTLEDRYWKGGIAEAFKVAMIKDPEFFEQLCEWAPALGNRDSNRIESVVEKAALLHLKHIATSGDPFEYGTARPLDFGHWAAHKLEILSNYRLSHGEAVAIGLALDTCYATAAGYLTVDARDRTLHAMQTIGLPTWSSKLEACADDGHLMVLKGLDEFREHLGGELTVTLPDGIGKGVEVHTMDHALITDAIDFLKQATPSAS